jgi:hypothetical protein
VSDHGFQGDTHYTIRSKTSVETKLSRQNEWQWERNE